MRFGLRNRSKKKQKDERNEVEDSGDGLLIAEVEDCVPGSGNFNLDQNWTLHIALDGLLL